jgi:hypothetical protein
MLSNKEKENKLSELVVEEDLHKKSQFVSLKQLPVKLIFLIFQINLKSRLKRLAITDVFFCKKIKY